MKIRSINITVILIFVAMLQTIAMVYAQPMITMKGHPRTTLLAYHNKVSDVVYNDVNKSISFACTVDPICMYTPLTYVDSLEKSLIKTYFLPRTKYADFKKHHEHTDMYESLKQQGITLEIHEVNHKNYGLQINFIMPSHDAYDIIKVIDRETKIVRFDIVAKI